MISIHTGGSRGSERGFVSHPTAEPGIDPKPRSEEPVIFPVMQMTVLQKPTCLGIHPRERSFWWERVTGWGYIYFSFPKKKISWEFPGGPVVKTL